METFDRIRMMFDDQTSTIIRLTSQVPRTASQICRELQIPRSVCYRKLKVLVDAQLIDVCESGSSWPAKGHAAKYVSNIDRAYISLEHGEMCMVLKLKNSDQMQISKISTDALSL